MKFISSNLELLWERITFSRLTMIYFIFSIVHCFVQVILQVQAFSINSQAATFLYSVLKQGNASDPNSFTVLGKHDLRMCDHVPNSLSTSSCRVVWDGTALDDSSMPSFSSSASSIYQTVSSAQESSSSSPVATATTSSIPTSVIALNPNVVVDAAAVGSATTTVAFATGAPPSVNDHDHDHDHDHDDDKKHKRDHDGVDTIATDIDGQIQVTVNGLGHNDEDIILGPSCLWALNYPVDILLNTKREDITFIAFQFWVLGMSIVAILNESIPHILASLLTHMLATAWAGFQISHTRTFRTNFSRLTTNGACEPYNLLPTYWKDRGNAEIPSLVLNVVALVVSALLTWRLVKLFGWQTFKRVGASLVINRLYKLVLTLSIVIQLSFFFMVVTIGLWLDQLWNGRIAHLAVLAHVYKPVFLVVFVLLFPWLVTGWFAVRRELRIPMLIFLILSFGYLLGWGVMFASATFRWTFVQWRFFGLMASGSALLTVMACIMGLICRMNFGRGLLRYLTAQEPILDEAVPDVYHPSTNDEKVDFPSHAQIIPTFSVAFGSGGDVPPPTQMFVGHQRGPRFYRAPQVPPEQHMDGHVTVSPPPYTRPLSPEHGGPQPSLTRQDSLSSVGSRAEKTVERNNSQSSQASSTRSKRWVIE